MTSVFKILDYNSGIFTRKKNSRVCCFSHFCARQYGDLRFFANFQQMWDRITLGMADFAPKVPKSRPIYRAFNCMFCFCRFGNSPRNPIEETDSGNSFGETRPGYLFQNPASEFGGPARGAHAGGTFGKLTQETHSGNSFRRFLHNLLLGF